MLGQISYFVKFISNKKLKMPEIQNWDVMVKLF